MSVTSSIVVVYGTYADVEAGVRELRRAGFDVKRVSLVGKEYHREERVVGYYNEGDRMKYWGKMGVFWGDMWSMLMGAAFFALPGIGPVLIAGPLAGWVVDALEGSVEISGLSPLGAALYSIGIPKENILRYEMAVRACKFLVVAHGASQEVIQARDTLRITQPDEMILNFSNEEEMNAA